MSCKIIEAKSHPDLLWIEGVREIPISAIRDLQNHLSLSTWQSSFKIAVIEQAHLMNQEAQSSLLKSLEEPKKNTVFLLLTSHPDLLFDTIRSRAQELRWYVFPKSQDNKIKKELEQLERLRNSLFSERFEYAKKAGETAQDVILILLQWIEAQRARLLGKLQDSDGEVLKEGKTLKTMQEMLHALETTNVTPRLALALEQVLLEL
jgi:DNA polymerase-3 subunit delta'